MNFTNRFSWKKRSDQKAGLSKPDSLTMGNAHFLDFTCTGLTYQ